MKNKLYTISLLILISALGVTACKAKELTFSPEVQEQLEQAVKKDLKKFGGETPIPTAIIGIWYPGKGSWVKGIGKDVDVDDKVRIGSNTKTFLVTVLLQLVDEGKLSLDDPLSKFDLGVKIPNAENITLRQLCNMTSGLFEVYDSPGTEKLAENPLTEVDPHELIRMAVKNPPYFPPGKGWYYSNTGYLLLGLIIENVTGKKVEDEIENRLIKPLHLNNTTFPTKYTGMPCPYMHGYDLDDNKNWKDASIALNPTITWAAGVMISDMADMKKWVKAYVTGTTNSAATQKERLECVETGKEHGKFGLGIACTNGWYGYTGGLPGYNTAAYYLPSKDATIIAFVGAEILKPLPGVANTIFGDITKILFPDAVAW